MAPLIEAVDVSKRFPGGLGREGTLALAGLSLAIDAEEPSIIAVVGESGSGKTTLARLLLGLAEPTGGAIRYRGTELRRLDRDGRRAAGQPLGWRHIGMYGYRREVLLRLAALPPTPLEESEQLEQLRALGNGIAIGVVEWTGAAPLIEVDTADDLARAWATLAATGPAAASG